MKRWATAAWTSALAGPAGKWRTVAVSALHVALVWATAAVIMWQNYQQSVDTWKTSTENASITVAAHAAQTLRAADLVLSSVSDWIHDEDIQTQEQFYTVMRERRFFLAMRDRVVGVPQIGMAVIASANGDVLNSLSGWPAITANLADREAFRSALDPAAPRLLLSASTKGLNDGPWRFFLSRKLTARSGEVLGVIGAGLDAEYFATFFRRLSPGPDSWLALFRADGSLLATSLADQNLLGKRYDDSLPYRLIAAGQSGKAVLTGAVFRYNPASSPTRIVVGTVVDGFPAYVSIVAGESSFLAPWRNRNYLILGIAALLTLLTVLAGLRILRLIDRSEAAHRAESERQVLAAIVDTPSALTAAIDRSGKVVHCNARFRELLGAGVDDTRALFNPALKGAEPLLAFAADSTRSAAEIDLEVEQPDGPNRQLHFSLSRQSLPDTGDCIIMVGHDETQRRQAQQAIAMSTRLVTLGEITTSIAHEVSQPLNVIRMAAQNALAEAAPALAPADAETAQAMSDADFRDFAVGKFNRIVAQVDRAASVVSRMRIFSRKPGDDPAFDVREACRNALTLLARNADIELRQTLPDESLVARGSQPLIEQVIIFLLRNAREALVESDRIDKVIEVAACRAPGDRIVIRIADNGPGVPAAIRERIFEPFFTTKPNDKHSGLGLALAFGAVRDSGGRLTLLDEGPGAAFQIELPAKG